MKSEDCSIDHDALIEAATSRVREHAELKCGGIGPYVEAIELLERLAPTSYCDQRILLGIEIVEGLGLADRPALAARAFLASFPPGSTVRDPRLQRRWHSNMGGIWLHTGNIVGALQHMAIAFEMAKRQSDHLGLANTWIPLSALANGAGQYQDAIAYSGMTLKHFELAGESLSGGYFPRLPIAAHFNRGNALFRLGRLESAAHDLLRVAALCGNRTDAWFLGAHVGALCVLAEVLILEGKTSEAGTVLDNARALVSNLSIAPAAWLSIRRVEGQLQVWRGASSAGLEQLLSVLSEVEREFGPAAYDGELMDVLYALERSYRKLDDTERANKVLTKIGAYLRTNCERAFVAMAELKPLPVARPLSSALEELDKFMGSKSQARATLDLSGAVSVDALQHLVALAASACAVEEASGEHCIRVARLCREVALRLRPDEDEFVRVIEYAALVHDAGKAGVPSSTLAKSSELSAHEASLLADHASYGAQLVELSELPGRTKIAEIVRLHHRRFDEHLLSSRGPLDTPLLEAAVLATCDQFDAMISGRPRRPAVAVAQALRQVFRASGTEFDPIVVQALIGVVREIAMSDKELLAFLASDAEKFSFTAARRIIRGAMM